MNEPRLECFDCIAAESGVHHGFTNGCMVCRARAASRSPPFRKSQAEGKLTREYRALLEQFGLTHQQVRDAAARDAEANIAAARGAPCGAA